MWWKFVLVGLLGMFVGLVMASVCISSGKATSIYDAYNEGYLDGRKSINEEK